MPISNQTKQKIFGPFLILIGSVVVVAGIWAIVNAGRLKSDGVLADGTVTNHRESSSRRGGKTYYLSVDYPAQGGSTVHKEFSVSKSSFDANREGAVVKVRHLASDPDNAEMMGEEQNGLLPLGLGTVMVLVGGLISRAAYRKPTAASGVGPPSLG